MDVILISGPQRLGWAVLAALLWLLLCLWAGYRHRQRNATGRMSVLVAYASQTGTAQALAQATFAQIQSLAGPDHAIQLLPLDRIRLTHLRRSQRLLLVVSTSGKGEAPENARQFVQRFLGSSPEVSNLEYALLGLGDRRYTRFCGFADDLDDWLSARGAVRLCPVLRADRSDPRTLEQWHRNIALLTGPEATARGEFKAGMTKQI